MDLQRFVRFVDCLRVSPLGEEGDGPPIPDRVGLGVPGEALVELPQARLGPLVPKIPLCEEIVDLPGKRGQEVLKPEKPHDQEGGDEDT